MVFVSICLLSTFSSCSDLDRGDGISINLSKLGLTKSHEEIARCQTDFGVDFFKSIYAFEKKNMVVSPFSMSMDLAMLSAGTAGGTYKELSKGLGFEGYSVQELSEYYSAVVNYDRSADNPVFKVANALWINTEQPVKVKEEFVSFVNEYYGASVEEVAGNEDMLERLNKWASDNTDGLIDNIGSNPPSTWKTCLSNALYFESRWADEYHSVVKEFTDKSGNASEREFFKGLLPVGCSGYNLDWSNKKEPAMLCLPYSGNKSFAMLIIVPPVKNPSIDKFVESLSARKVSDMYNAMFEQKGSGNNDVVTFYVPAFEIDSPINQEYLIESLYSLGIKSIFSDGADFSKMSDVPLNVNQVNQRSIIITDAVGTTAASISAAYTAGAIYALHNYKYDFVVDRPFVFAIIDKFQNIHFMGAVVE